MPIKIINKNIGIILAIVGSFMYGTHNYLITYASRIPTNDRSHVCIEGISFLVCSLIYHLGQGVSNMRNYGKFWD